MKRPLIVIAALAAGALALAACGEQKNVLTAPPGKVQPLTLMLDWSPNADHVGIYQAQAEGDFRRAALNVHVVYNTADPSAPLRLLEAGKVDVAIAYEPEVMLARSQGAPLASVAAIMQRPLTTLVSLGKAHITTPADLRGKTVGVAGIPYQNAFLKTLLAHAGVPESSVKVVNVGENLVGSMLTGKVAATLGAYWNYEAIQLAQLGKHPNVIHMEQAGVPTYDELVFVVREAELVSHPDVIRRFVQAVARGYAAARAHPQQAVANLLRLNPSAGLSPKLQLASVEATTGAWFPAGGKPWGWQNQTQWNAFGQWMLSNHLITNPSAIAAASTNELLAGQGI